MAGDVNSQNQAVVFSKDDLRHAPYTNTLLSHAHPEHLHQTTARLFIGPIPQGWLKTHKRTWYGTKKKYTNRAITFTAQSGLSNRPSVTGLIDHEAARETVTSVSEQVISQSGSDLPTSLQFTSDSGTSSSNPPLQTTQTELERSLPTVRFLSPRKQREEEDDLERLEEERIVREREQGELVDLKPVPSKGELRRPGGAGQLGNGVGGASAPEGRGSDERPLLRDLGEEGHRRVSDTGSIEAWR